MLIIPDIPSQPLLDSSGFWRCQSLVQLIKRCVSVPGRDGLYRKFGEGFLCFLEAVTPLSRTEGLRFPAARGGAELTANPLHPTPCRCWGNGGAGSGYGVPAASFRQPLPGFGGGGDFVTFDACLQERVGV